MGDCKRCVETPLDQKRNPATMRDSERHVATRWDRRDSERQSATKVDIEILAATPWNCERQPSTIGDSEVQAAISWNWKRQ